MSGSSASLGFLGGLCLLFIGLKLGKVIVWSWWWVLSPIWVPLALMVLMATVVLMAAAILNKRDNIKDNVIRKRPKIKT